MRRLRSLRRAPDRAARLRRRWPLGGNTGAGVPQARPSRLGADRQPAVDDAAGALFRDRARGARRDARPVPPGRRARVPHVGRRADGLRALPVRRLHRARCRSKTTTPARWGFCRVRTSIACSRPRASSSTRAPERSSSRTSSSTAAFPWSVAGERRDRPLRSRSRLRCTRRGTSSASPTRRSAKRNRGQAAAVACSARAR